MLYNIASALFFFLFFSYSEWLLKRELRETLSIRSDPEEALNCSSLVNFVRSFHESSFDSPLNTFPFSFISIKI